MKVNNKKPFAIYKHAPNLYQDGVWELHSTYETSEDVSKAWADILKQKSRRFKYIIMPSSYRYIKVQNPDKVLKASK